MINKIKNLYPVVE